MGQSLDGYAGYAWLIHQLLPVTEKECGTLHRGGQGRRLTSKSTCTTQEYGYSLPWQCTTTYIELYACDGWDKQNSSRTSSLLCYLPRKQKVNRSSIFFLMEIKVLLPLCHILFRTPARILLLFVLFLKVKSSQARLQLTKLVWRGNVKGKEWGQHWQSDIYPVWLHRYISEN